MPRFRPALPLAAVASLTLLLAACGGGGGSSGSSASTATTSLPANCVNTVSTPAITSVSGPQLVALAKPTSCGFLDTAVTLRQPTAMAEDGAGDIFIADTGNNTVREISFTGVSSTLAGTAGVAGSADGVGAAASFRAPAGIAVDSNANIYVADTGNDTIRKLSYNNGTWTVSTLAGSAGQPGAADAAAALGARFNQPEGLSVDGSGNLYIADTGNDTVRELAAGSVSTLAGSAGLPGSVDGTGPAARFSAPTSVVYDPFSSTVYVADSGNNTIRQLTPGSSSWTSTTVAGAAGVAGHADGTGTAMRFNDPTGLAVDSAGNVYVSDTGNDTVRLLNPPGGSGSTWNGTTFVGVAGQAGNSDTVPGNYNQPRAVTVDANDTLNVLDTGNNSLRRVINGSDPILSTLAGSSGQPGSADGVISLPSLQSALPPTGMSSDTAGNLYIGELATNFVRKVSSAGVSTVFAGTPDVFGSSDGVGAEGSFDYISDVARDSQGNLFVADFDNGLVRKITPDGVMTTLAGNATATGIVDGTGSAANFDEIWAITVDPNDNVFVTDLNTVREITPAGVVTTIAGNGNLADATTNGSTDGVGTNALFSYPEGIASDSAGNLYVADSGNGTIRKLTPTTSSTGTVWTVSTLAGNPASVGSADGTGSKALFNDPYRLTVDSGTGAIYVTDRGNATVRRLTPSGTTATVTTVLGTVGSSTVSTGLLGSATLSSPTAIALLPGGQLAILDSGELLVTEGGSF